MESAEKTEKWSGREELCDSSPWVSHVSVHIASKALPVLIISDKIFYII